MPPKNIDNTQHTFMVLRAGWKIQRANKHTNWCFKYWQSESFLKELLVLEVKIRSLPSMRLMGLEKSPKCISKK